MVILNVAVYYDLRPILRSEAIGVLSRGMCVMLHRLCNRMLK